MIAATPNLGVRNLTCVSTVRRTRRCFACSLAAVLSLALMACGRPGVVVKSRDYGESWPLSAPEAETRCEPPGSNIVVIVRGKTYARNTRARESGRWADYQTITKLEHEFKGVPMVLRNHWIARGLALCD
jgi:hypothetical protein